MSREWKPGDVASVLQKGTLVALRTEADGYGFRPLVVIDPEDREACRVLADRIAPDMVGNTNATQAALRSLLEPPRPKEPTGLGAVVEDEEGEKWVRWKDGGGYPWSLTRDGVAEYADYAEVKVARVLSKGWSE